MESPNSPKAEVLEYAGMDVYHDRAEGCRREFVLSEDQLFLRSRRLLGDETHVPIPLRAIEPNYAVVRKRNPQVGLAPLIGPILVGLFLLPVLGTGVSLSAIKWPIIVTIALALMSLAISAMGLRRIEYASFGHNGGAKFTIAKRGPDRARFDSFVSRLVERIQKAHAQALPEEIELHPASPAAPLATFRFRISLSWRSLTLYEDRLIVHARKIFTSETQTPISLHTINPAYAKGWGRRIGAAISLSVFGALLAAVSTAPLLLPDDPSTVTRSPITGKIGEIVIVLLALLCFVGAIRSLRKIEYVIFGYNGGRLPIYRLGPDRAHFDDFITGLINRIQTLRAQAIAEHQAMQRQLAESNAPVAKSTDTTRPSGGA